MMVNKTLVLLVLVLMLSVATAHKQRGKGNSRPKQVCKYKPKRSSKCDESGIQTVTLTSKKAGDIGCPDKVIKRQCKEAVIWAQMRQEDRKLGCKYSKGVWGLCNSTSNMRPLVTTLINLAKIEKGCESERVRQRPCKFGCMYTHGEWSECDEETKLRTKQLTLIEGSPTDCPATDTKSMKCQNAKGKEKCSYGKWSEFGTCIKGKVTRTRQLLAGGGRCKKRTSQSKKCKKSIQA